VRPEELVGMFELRVLLEYGFAMVEGWMCVSGWLEEVGEVGMELGAGAAVLLLLWWSYLLKGGLRRGWWLRAVHWGDGGGWNDHGWV
jgi:hypothetical protein